MSVDKLDVALLRRSKLFDAEWYLNTYPDVEMLGMDPAEHYLWLGALLNRNPSADFSTEAYVEANPEAGQEGNNPLVHFLRSTQSGEAHEPPYYGAQFRDLVTAAKARLKKPGNSKVYDAIRDEFDVAYYLMRYRDIARAAKVDVVQHYINAGAKEGRDPSPHFSTKRYMARYPEVKQSGLNPFYHWLTQGRDKGNIAENFSNFEGMCEVLGQPPAEVQKALAARRNDLQDRLAYGVLGEMVAKATELDPLVSHTWPEAFQIKVPPFHSDQIVNRVTGLHALQKMAEMRRARAVIVVNRPRWGGARRMEGHIAHALADFLGADEIVVVVSDEGGPMPENKFPDGVRYVDFPSAMGNLNADQRQRLLVEFLRSLRPDAVFNVNSGLLWNALTPYGKPLAACTKIIGCLFCNEKTALGHWTGYPVKHFYRHFDVLSAVCPDSHFLAQELASRFVVPPEQLDKIRVLEGPVDQTQALIPAPQTSPSRRPQVFWSGRFDAQKRVDLVYRIAAAMPHVDIRMWGEPVMTGGKALPPKPDNVSHEGVYARFEDLPLQDADLWLYTAEWDGVPSILLELGMTGVPLVGSIAGGTGEVLREGLSWPVTDIEDVGAYQKGIEAVLADPEAARRRGQELRQELAAERTLENYTAALKPIFQDVQAGQADG